MVRQLRESWYQYNIFQTSNGGFLDTKSKEHIIRNHFCHKEEEKEIIERNEMIWKEMRMEIESP